MGQTKDPGLHARQYRNLLAISRTKILIRFKLLDGGKWRVVEEVIVDPSHQWEARRLVVKYANKRTGITIRDKQIQLLCFETCVADVISDGTNTIFRVQRCN
jgi:hypothetical protein